MRLSGVAGAGHYPMQTPAGMLQGRMMYDDLSLWMF
jgi:hypothetical protein